MRRPKTKLESKNHLHSVFDACHKWRSWIIGKLQGAKTVPFLLCVLFPFFLFCSRLIVRRQFETRASLQRFTFPQAGKSPAWLPVQVGDEIENFLAGEIGTIGKDHHAEIAVWVQPHVGRKSGSSA